MEFIRAGRLRRVGSSEGLGTVFEAPGVWDSATYPARSDRLNRERLRDYRNWQQTKRPAEAVAILVQSDRPFQTNSIAAYAEAWALSFYLIECLSARISQYLKKTTQRQPFSEYTAKNAGKISRRSLAMMCDSSTHAFSDL